MWSEGKSEMASQKAIRIYTTGWCGFCHRAKHLLADAGLKFEEIDVDGDFDKRQWLQKETGQRTVPQIFFGDESIGGCSELEALVRSGVLKKRVAA